MSRASLLDVWGARQCEAAVRNALLAVAKVLPVIALSSSDDPTARHLARELGAQSFFRKPVDAAALLDSIEWVMQGDGRSTRNEDGIAFAPCLTAIGQGDHDRAPSRAPARLTQGQRGAARGCHAQQPAIHARRNRCARHGPGRLRAPTPQKDGRQAVPLERHAFERLLANLSERLGDVAEPDFLARTEAGADRLLVFLAAIAAPSPNSSPATT